MMYIDQYYNQYMFYYDHLLCKKFVNYDLSSKFWEYLQNVYVVQK